MDRYFIKVTGIPAPKTVMARIFEDKMVKEKKMTEPEDVAKAWVGAILATKAPIAGLFEVGIQAGIDGLLKLNSREAYETVVWWRNTNLVEQGGVLVFHHSCCEVVDEQEIVGAIKLKENEQCWICSGWGAHKRWCPTVSKAFILA